MIPVDCLFSPVRRVKYETENTRVGRQTDYDKLIIEIWTDGRVSPGRCFDDVGSDFASSPRCICFLR